MTTCGGIFSFGRFVRFVMVRIPVILLTFAGTLIPTCMMIEDAKIEKINFNEVELEKEYVNCTFANCDFSAMNLTDLCFEDCTFVSCNFSLSKIINSNLSDAQFMECKMTGTNFTNSGRLSSFVFEKCHLQYASFVGMNLKSTKFVECNLHETYFSEANLSGSTFTRCDLMRAEFFKTNLEKVDFTSSYHFTIDPNSNRLKKARFAQNNLSGLLAHLGIVIED